ncbi:MAG: F510_1955 family glycosylhydrolase [Solirubrobacteraceae bacterium]
MRQLAAHAAAGLAAVTLAACGGEPSVTDPQPSSQETSSSVPEPGAELGHIHGLGVNAGTLYIATHYGLWTAPEGQTRAERFGESTQDVMGFSVVGRDRFIGSGHPDPSQQLPPNLGLIESSNGGENWKSRSLLGRADFHVLESAGRRVYGFDGTQGRLMVSSDGGGSWEQRTPPAGVFSLAIDPDDPDRVVVSTEAGLFASLDSGKGWRPVNDRLAGLLAWPSADCLFLVDGQGQVQVSRDVGRRWEAVGSIGGAPAAFIADGSDLYAALGDGSVKRSSDGGRSWTVRASP